MRVAEAGGSGCEGHSPHRLLSSQRKLAGASAPAFSRMVRAEEMDAIRRAAMARRDQEAKAREHAADLGTLFAGIAERLRSIDPDFHRHDVAQLLDAAGALGHLDRAVDLADEG